MVTLTVTTTQDESFEGSESQGAPDGNGLSLREAFGLLNADPDVDTITFDPAIFNDDFNATIAGDDTAVIRLTGGDTLDVSLGAQEETLTIDGDVNDGGTPDVVIAGDDAGDDMTLASERIFFTSARRGVINIDSL